MKIIVKRATGKLNSKSGVVPKELKVIYAVRTVGDERNLGQYKLIEDGVAQYFNNFKALRYYSSLVLYSKHKHVIISKGEIDGSNDSIC